MRVRKRKKRKEEKLNVVGMKQERRRRTERKKKERRKVGRGRKEWCIGIPCSPLHIFFVSVQRIVYESPLHSPLPFTIKHIHFSCNAFPLPRTLFPHSFYFLPSTTSPLRHTPPCNSIVVLSLLHPHFSSLFFFSFYCATLSIPFLHYNLPYTFVCLN